MASVAITAPLLLTVFFDTTSSAGVYPSNIIDVLEPVSMEKNASKPIYCSLLLVLDCSQPYSNGSSLPSSLFIKQILGATRLLTHSYMYTCKGF